MVDGSTACYKRDNAILDEVGSGAERAATYRLYDPPEFRTLKQVDALLYKAGLPNALDVV